MDKFAYDEYTRFASKAGAANVAEGTQFARLVMSHIDCDTIPFFWRGQAASLSLTTSMRPRTHPPSPNAVAMIAGQSGETQWVKHGPNGQIYSRGHQHWHHARSTDRQGSISLSTVPSSTRRTSTSNPPVRKENYSNSNIASNLTFATLPLTFQGSNITEVMEQNLNPIFDTPDIQQDIPYIQDLDIKPVNWRWYQEGYDLESTDTTGRPRTCPTSATTRGPSTSAISLTRRLFARTSVV